jgi:hypothetical protein
MEDTAGIPFYPGNERVDIYTVGLTMPVFILSKIKLDPTFFNIDQHYQT